jgi:CheY-like chemotaxis protein
LIILDMIMPGMDGSRTFDQLRDIESVHTRAVIKWILFKRSGKQNYAERMQRFLQKPFLITNYPKR